MDKEIHCELLREILQYFQVSDQDINNLIEYTKKPDEKAKENIEKYELPPAKNILGEIKNDIKWVWNAFVQGVTWIHLHGRGAPEQFLYHFNKAYNILIEKKPISEEIKIKGLKNIAYSLHYVVDIGTPYHSKRFSDVLNIHEIYQIQDSLSEEELKNYYYSKFVEIILFISNHSKFENDIKNFWSIPQFKEEYKKVIIEAVTKADRSHGFTTPPELEEFFEELILNLKNRAVENYDHFQDLYLIEDEKKSCKKIDENYLNQDVFEYSKKCIYDIALVISLILNIFFDKKDEI